jgi:ATP-binding protein involved in chromosome partitioning
MHKIEKVTLPDVKHIIGIASGKGGVGKSTVAANMALVFAQNGYKTALIDADLFGPSIPTLFGIEEQKCIFEQHDNKEMIIPIEKFGVKLMSIGFLLETDKAVVWRGPLAASTLLQLFTFTLWGEIDYMFIDLPPGTGDIPLTLCQQVDMEGVVVVTTPQHLSLADVNKAIDMFKNKDLNIPLLGIVENMSWFSPIEHPEEKYFLFGKDGGKSLARKFKTELLIQIPLVQGMSEASDKGSFYGYSQSKMVQDIYRQLFNKILVQV